MTAVTAHIEGEDISSVQKHTIVRPIGLCDENGCLIPITGQFRVWKIRNQRESVPPGVCTWKGLSSSTDTIHTHTPGASEWPDMKTAISGEVQEQKGFVFKWGNDLNVLM